jgi:Mn2+/Fe2+ NRAMP family transporter
MGGAALLVTKIDPIAMLFWTAVINGFVAVPIMAAMMALIGNKRQARRIALPRWLLVLGWLAALLMALVVALLIWSSVA